MTAVAAGPTLWQALQVRLGAFAPYAAPAEGAVVESGVEVALAGSLSDGYVARVYFTVTDPAGRLNEHTNVTARLETADGPLAGGAGCHVLSWDAEAGRLLVEASLVGVGSGSAATLTVTGLDPSYRYETEAAFFPPERAQTLETEEAAEGQAVLRAGQTPQASPDTEDFSISSMGFDGEGRLHIRLAMAEGFANRALLAVPYNAEQEQMGATLDQFAVDGGTDYVIGGITPARKLQIFAEQFGVQVAWHGPGDMSPLAHAANIHIDLAAQNLGVQEWSGIEPPNYVIQELKGKKGALLDVFPGLPEFRGGYVYPNEKPGLGVDLVESEAAKYPCENTVTTWTQTRERDGSLRTP